MNRRRNQSLELLRLLQPFTQAGILMPAKAKKIVDEYVSGDTTELKNFVYSPDIPVAYNSVLKTLFQFI